MKNGYCAGPELFWGTDRVVRELGVSRPTAYKLMHASGALVRTPRRLRVYVPRFIEYLRSVDEEAPHVR